MKIKNLDADDIIIMANTSTTLLCARYCFTCFTHINSFALDNNPLKWLRIIPSL